MSDYALTEDRALTAILQVAEEVAEPITYPDNYVVLDCGAVLEITGIAPETYNSVVRKFEDSEPKVPIVTLVSKGGRQEPNPNDPEYMDRLQKWKNARSAGLLLAIYAFGASVVSAPESMPGPDSEEFKAGLTLSGLLGKGTPTECRIHWIQNALSRDKVRGGAERTAIFKAAIRAMGVSESDVQDAVKRT